MAKIEDLNTLRNFWGHPWDPIDSSGEPTINPSAVRGIGEVRPSRLNAKDYPGVYDGLMRDGIFQFNGGPPPAPGFGGANGPPYSTEAYASWEKQYAHPRDGFTYGYGPHYHGPKEWSSYIRFAAPKPRWERYYTHTQTFEAEAPGIPTPSKDLPPVSQPGS